MSGTIKRGAGPKGRPGVDKSKQSKNVKLAKAAKKAQLPVDDVGGEPTGRKHERFLYAGVLKRQGQTLGSVWWKVSP